MQVGTHQADVQKQPGGRLPTGVPLAMGSAAKRSHRKEHGHDQAWVRRIRFIL